MIIEISDEIAKQCGIDAKEALELLAVAIYKAKGIHGTMAGKILGISEPEFHAVVALQGQPVNADVADLPDERHRTLQARAALHGHSTEAEVRDILAAAVKPDSRWLRLD